MTNKQILNEIFDNLKPNQEFHAWELKKAYVSYRPEKAECYVDTVMRQARDYCRDRFICLSKQESLYRKIK